MINKCFVPHYLYKLCSVGSIYAPFKCNMDKSSYNIATITTNVTGEPRTLLIAVPTKE